MASKSGTDSLTADKTAQKIKPPEMYKVVLLNDHYTPMDFVVDVLRTIFHKNPIEATRVMLEVHKKGKGLAGVYNHDIAATKVQQVEQLARLEEYPLRCTLERT